VTDRPLLAKICREIVSPGGYIIISVPYSYPYHADPIDTYFRPSPAELASLFPGCEIVASNVVSESTYWDELQQKGTSDRLITVAKLLLHLPIPFYRWPIWKNKMHKLLWLFRPYRVSVIALHCL
jgi:hypothetical protein